MSILVLLFNAEDRIKLGWNLSQKPINTRNPNISPFAWLFLPLPVPYGDNNSGGAGNREVTLTISRNSAAIAGHWNVLFLEKETVIFWVAGSLEILYIHWPWPGKWWSLIKLETFVYVKRFLHIQVWSHYEIDFCHGSTPRFNAWALGICPWQTGRQVEHGGATNHPGSGPSLWSGFRSSSWLPSGKLT